MIGVREKKTWLTFGGVSDLTLADACPPPPLVADVAPPPPVADALPPPSGADAWPPPPGADVAVADPALEGPAGCARALIYFFPSLPEKTRPETVPCLPFFNY